ncbi:DUF397 domain-containing protein [Actinomadura alba]|uniref:DUF397 domain-containing protein n=1 Tax=Actinomadura alba TaxID=406431 RepID=A0ABR7LHC8_9ACTN|nr:DUF397 domain-containing protein [Actinomadura alba]MBC6464237.1 DUF397 domain-containing protein [Actinomadura alba]
MSSPTLIWRKAARSTGTGSECVEVAALPAAVAVRDSKNPDGPKLAFDSSTWAAFAGRVKAGELDL